MFAAEIATRFARGALAALVVIAGTAGALAQLGLQPGNAAAENALIAKANAAIQAQDWKTAADLARQLSALQPARWEYRRLLGDAQGNLNQYQDAIAAYDSAVVLAGKSMEGNPADAAKTKEAMGQMLTQEGNLYLKLRKNNEAIGAFTKAAAVSPYPDVAYFDLCATQFNMGNSDAALAACNKAIAANPRKADAYFVKGSVLMGNSTLGANGKLVPPPGTVAALKKYLELEPNGAHAKDAKEMLDAVQ